jgi:hypothetical protein
MRRFAGKSKTITEKSFLKFEGKNLKIFIKKKSIYEEKTQYNIAL